MAKIVAITTNDNPNDPFDEFEKWYAFDNDYGYNTCGRLAVAARTSEALTPQENAIALEEAIDDIISHDYAGIFRKAVKEVTEEEANEYYLESVG